MRPINAAARRSLRWGSRIAVTTTATVAVAALLLAPAPAAAVNYWVGNGGNPPCTHADLQSAIDTAVGGAGFDFIFLVGPGPFTGPFTVLGSDFEIVGNVAACGSAISVGASHVRAASGSRPLTILSGGAGTVRLRNLEVNTQQGTFNGDGGSIWFAGASPASRLELLDTRVNGNTALGDGGGIFVSQGRLLLSRGAQVALNAANRGGGVAASNGAVVELHGGSVLVNTALLDGGGIWAEESQVRVENLSLQTTTAVVSNLAGRDGGGLYLLGGQEHSVSGLAAEPSAVGSNQAQRGGGLFVDAGTVRMDYALLDFNQASGEGGGAYVTGDGALVSSTFSGPPTLGGFPRVEENSAPKGAAVHVADGALVLASGRIRDHHAGAAMVAVTGDGVALLHGVVVEGNSIPALFGLEDEAELNLVHTTIVGNTVGGVVRWHGDFSELVVYSTVLDETEPFFLAFDAPAAPPQFGCVLSHYASPFAVVPPGTNLAFVTVADPQLVAPPADVHLRSTSPAIDLCPLTAVFDFDGDHRSHDDPYHPNAIGMTADAGADEATVLFYDGYESGSLGAWSGAVP